MKKIDELKQQLIKAKLENEKLKSKQFERKQELTAQKHELAIDKFINQKKRYRNASIAKWIMAAITIALIIVIVIVCVNGAGDTIIYK